MDGFGKFLELRSISPTLMELSWGVGGKYQVPILSQLYERRDLFYGTKILRLTSVSSAAWIRERNLPLPLETLDRTLLYRVGRKTGRGLMLACLGRQTDVEL